MPLPSAIMMGDHDTKGELSEMLSTLIFVVCEMIQYT